MECCDAWGVDAVVIGEEDVHGERVGGEEEEEEPHPSPQPKGEGEELLVGLVWGVRGRLCRR